MLQRYTGEAWQDIEQLQKNTGSFADCEFARRQANGGWIDVWTNGIGPFVVHDKDLFGFNKITVDGDTATVSFFTTRMQDQYIIFHYAFPFGIRWEDIILDLDIIGEHFLTGDAGAYYTTTYGTLYLSNDAVTWDRGVRGTILLTVSMYHQVVIPKKTGIIYDLYIKFSAMKGSDQALESGHIVTVTISNFKIGGKKCKFQYP